MWTLSALPKDAVLPRWPVEVLLCACVCGCAVFGAEIVLYLCLVGGACQGVAAVGAGETAILGLETQREGGRPAAEAGRPAPVRR